MQNNFTKNILFYVKSYVKDVVRTVTLKAERVTTPFHVCSNTFCCLSVVCVCQNQIRPYLNVTFPDPVTNEDATAEKTTDEEFPYMPMRPAIPRPKVRVIPTPPRLRTCVHRDMVFETSRFNPSQCIRIKIKNCRSIDLPKRRPERPHTNSFTTRGNVTVAASGLLNRFRYRLKKSNDAFPILGALTF